jgi:hypothetical protein
MIAWAPPSSAREIQSEVLAGTRTMGVRLTISWQDRVLDLPMSKSSTAELVRGIKTEGRVLEINDDAIVFGCSGEANDLDTADQLDR